MNKRSKYKDYSNIDKTAILEFYLLNKNNSMAFIAEKFDVTVYKVDQIVNEYFESKKLKK